MTPVNLITFLISLYLVDCRFQSQREHVHDSRQQSRWPAWLHHFIFRPQPYSWVGGGPSPPNEGDKHWYYHTKQKKLMKMEAAAAFEMRRSVLLAMMAVGFGLSWGISKLLAKAVDRYM